MSPRQRLVVSIIAFIASVAVIFIVPQVLELFAVINATIYVSMAILALSLALIWGAGGILSFGQAAFFGLGGYTYAVCAINFGDSTWAVVLAVMLPALFAALLGYFIFWGRIGDVYLGVITLTVTLILFKLFNATAGDAYTIGKARLGGFNGIPSTPPLNLPWDVGTSLPPEQIWYIAAGLLLLFYFGSRWLLSTGFGRVVISIRENERRTELLGYDVRRYKLGIFTIGGAMAGVAGILFANCVFVSPTMFSLFYNAQVIIWVTVGGIGTLLGPIMGAIALQMLVAKLGTINGLDPNVVLGFILILFVLLVPKGILPVMQGGFERMRHRRAVSPPAPIRPPQQPAQKQSVAQEPVLTVGSRP
ncbi:MAG TPA: branched-chain amino acid ABC transporter permease [Burkholderiales bacterium]|nr:branched-chain amino acid ABC transporter permease [Burkholderiales bacterium]